MADHFGLADMFRLIVYAGEVPQIIDKTLHVVVIDEIDYTVIVD